MGLCCCIGCSIDSAAAGTSRLLQQPLQLPLFAAQCTCSSSHMFMPFAMMLVLLRKL